MCGGCAGSTVQRLGYRGHLLLLPVQHPFLADSRNSAPFLWVTASALPHRVLVGTLTKKHTNCTSQPVEPKCLCPRLQIPGLESYTP